MPLDPETERGYWVAHKGIAIMDMSIVGRLKMTGADALDLLHRISTQDLKNLKVGQGAAAVLTNEKGRILDVINIHVFPDHLFIFTVANLQTKTAAWIDKFTIAEDVQTKDIAAETAQIAFFGANALKLATMIAGPDIANFPRYYHCPADLGGPEAFIVVGSFIGGGIGYNLVLKQRKDLSKAIDYLLTKGESLGADMVGPRVYNVLRIERGACMYGRETDDRFNPLEAGFEQHISWTKGCYIGQEVIARLDSYQKVQKHLVGLTFVDDQLPRNGDKLTIDGHEVGFVTSATYSPLLQKNIGLGYVRTADTKVGTKLTAHTGKGEKPAEVAALPFVGN